MCLAGIHLLLQETGVKDVSVATAGPLGRKLRRKTFLTFHISFEASGSRDAVMNPYFSELRENKPILCSNRCYDVITSSFHALDYQRRNLEAEDGLAMNTQSSSTPPSWHDDTVDKNYGDRRNPNGFCKTVTIII